MAELVLSRPGISNIAEKHWSKNLPLGIGYLAASARAQGINVIVVDGKLEGHRTIEQTVKKILSNHPEIVGLSALTMEYPNAIRIAQKLKETNIAITTVLGGAHANALPAESLAGSSALDYVIAGEAETSLPELTIAIREKKPLTFVRGLFVRDKSGLVSQSEPAMFGHDISLLPFPAWDLFPRVDTYPLLSERGCPYQCVFCSRNMAHNVRSRPTQHVMEEIKWLHKDFAAKNILFEDETFGLHSERTEELLNKIIEFNRQKGIIFKAQTRVDCVSRSCVQLMKRAGFKYVELGIESGDPDVIARSRKGITLKQAEEAVKILKSEGIKVWAKFIIGLPGETKQTARHTIDLAVKLNPHRLSVATIVAYPGSKIYDWACEGKNGYRLLSKDWGRFDKYLSSSVELDNLSYLTMRRLQIQMYLEVYLRNYRFYELSRLLWKSWSFWFTLGRSMILALKRK